MQTPRVPAAPPKPAAALRRTAPLYAPGRAPWNRPVSMPQPRLGLRRVRVGRGGWLLGGFTLAALVLALVRALVRGYPRKAR